MQGTVPGIRNVAVKGEKKKKKKVRISGFRECIFKGHWEEKINK